MDNIHILIVEDNPAQSKTLADVLTAHSYIISAVAASYAEAIHLFYKNKVDLVIIDILLNDIPDGITFAETINTVPNSARPFVFLTSSKDRQIFERAKLAHPFSFLLKPFNELEILYAIEMAVEKFYGQQQVFTSEEPAAVVSKDFLFIKKKGALKKVQTGDIIYIEVVERYCNIITEKEKFLVQISLSKILDLVDTTLFYQTHRNYIVNAEKIIEIIPADNLILLQGNHQVLLSDTYKNFINRFHILK
ncbi:response regulator transcription factor [Chitinophaga sp. LS1]|uniref:LytR/AlgR family response regulator transcription factor n=1 Tax=Chitinophaga sp. LS1 TaxID=3051176 RepID=UPI002AAA9ADF|nr:response regulator transcription factor [Chitinophaga sp. LS1]WPV69211.1 response regulator transcription factor [Chitinophaga sp. LS1]